MLSTAQEKCQAWIVLIPAGLYVVRRFRMISIWLVMSCAMQFACAQSYPLKSIRMVVPYAPGGSVDVMARLFAPKLAEVMGQQVVIDNRPGASGNIGTEFVVHSSPDGYTILLVTLPLVVNPSLYTALPFDVMRDLAPVSLLVAAPFLLVSHPSLPVRSVRDLIGMALKQPGRLNYPSGGKGTNSHIAVELLDSMSGIRITHVPYKGGGPALVAILSGEADVGVLGYDVVIPHISSGRLRALGISSLKRSLALPELPTIAESGVPGYDFSSWYGVLAPAATPPSTVSLLYDHISKAMRGPDLATRLSRDGAEVVAGTPAQFAAHIKTEIARWSKVIKEIELRAD